MVNVSIFKIYVAPNVLKQQLEDYSAMYEGGPVADINLDPAETFQVW